MRRAIVIAFPVLVVLVHGIVWQQFADPSGWEMLLASGTFSALPMIALLVFEYRRKSVTDPKLGKAVRFAATAVFSYTVVLWIYPLVMVLAGVTFRFGLVWLGLVAAEPIYAYPLLLALERFNRGGATGAGLIDLLE